MPTYEYECTGCGPFEQFQRITEEALSSCPSCGSTVRRLISSGTGIIFKGSGFYSTDSRSEGSGKPSQNTGADNASKDGSGGGAKPDSKTKEKTDKKVDSPAGKKEPAAATTAAKD